MSIHVDPTLVAGFAGEVRSHLPEIHRALERFHGAADSSALGAARERLEGMRDASDMVGLGPLGQMLNALLKGLEQVPASDLPETPLALFDEYLGQLEDRGRSDIEPSQLLDQLTHAMSLDFALPAATSEIASASVSAPVFATEQSADSSEDSLPIPQWASRQPESDSTRKGLGPFEVQGSVAVQGVGPSPEVREIFAAESDEHAQVIARSFRALRPDIFQRETLSGLRRRVHNLKGSAALVRLDDLSQVAHAMEDLLDTLFEQQRGATATELSSLEVAVDALQALVYQGGKGVDVSSVLQPFAKVRAEAPQAPIENATLASEESAAATGMESATGSGPATVATALPTPAEEFVKTETADIGERKRFVRVSVDALDEAVRLLVEVEAERHRLQALVSSQNDYARELDLTDQRLHREVRALEAELEVSALGSGHSPSSKAASDSPFDALEFDRYTELHERSRTLIESTGDLESVRVGLGADLISMDHSIERLESVTLQLRDRLLGLRLVPFSTLGPRLEGVVRQAARDRQRPARLIVVDRGVELDKDILDALVDPLVHLLRNAVAHGVEPLAERRAKGKGETATVWLEASYAQQGVIVRVRDDGGGINLAKVGQQAVQRGIVTSEELASWDQSQIRELIFEPGLTTATTVDRVAGRGVGLDVVRERLRELQGQLGVESQEGLGATITLKLPTSLAVQRVLLVVDHGYHLAVPSGGLERLERVTASRIETMGNREVIRAGDAVFSVVRLADAAGLPRTAGALDVAEDRVAILTRSAGRSLAFLVEKIIDGREVVVQDLGRHLRQIPGILGVTHTGSGHPVPILDPVAWLEQEVSGATPTVRPEAQEVRRQQTVLVVDDSLSMRRYLSQLVGRFGFAGVEAKDGRDALELLSAGSLEISVFLLDLEMPRMDGFELMEALRADPRFRDVPRVVLSSRSAEKHRQRAAESGADAYLVKPVLEAELQSVLLRSVSRGRS